MAPKESTSLLPQSSSSLGDNEKTPHDYEENVSLLTKVSNAFAWIKQGSSRIKVLAVTVASAVFIAVIVSLVMNHKSDNFPSGAYHLVERQEGEHFFDFYNFYEGPDSLGSAGYNIYVNKKRAHELGIANTTRDPVTGKEFVFMHSMKTQEGEPRESIRLEGRRRYQHGLFILDLDHMPAGCGVWPAFWLTDEAHWPKNGEIDIVEGINRQPMAKTALHTSDKCDMYAHVPSYSWTGKWDTATGIPETWTGEPDYITRVEADNCWTMAPHQWANQGCVAVDQRNNTLGEPLNKAGGGLYALEWDPANKRIRSWVFPRNEGVPENLEAAVDTASASHASERIMPDTDEWGLPYAHFAIGQYTGCSADHFQDMRLVINLAFCGTVAGNRFLRDCPEIAKLNLTDKADPWETCTAYIESNPDALAEAFWKIRGAYVYQRS